jgi:hypothetical protein
MRARLGSSASFAGSAITSARTASMVRSTTTGAVARRGGALGGVSFASVRARNHGPGASIGGTSGSDHTVLARSHAAEAPGSRKSSRRTSFGGATTSPKEPSAERIVAVRRSDTFVRSDSSTAGAKVAPTSVAAVHAMAPCRPG